MADHFNFIDENTISYLDKGYVKLLLSAADASFVAKFARASFDVQDAKTAKEDERLINYLVEHEHTSPIEAGEMWFQAKLPLFVRDQLVRHRTMSMNIQSLRYSKHDGDYYLPSVDRMRLQDKWNKQGSGDPLDPSVALFLIQNIKDHSDSSYKKYTNMVSYGLAKETARMVIPTNFFVTMCFKVDTKNLMHFLKLRDDGHAQWEIQQLAKMIDHFFKREFPELHSAYVEHIKEGVRLSRKEIEAVRSLLSGEDVDIEAKLGPRQYRSLKSKLGIKDEI